MKSITLENITKVYRSAGRDVLAVDDISLQIEAGELFFLLGPSGCGKTTLLRMIAGLIDPSAGRLLLGDRDVTHVPVEKRNTALVFQNYALWPHMTVQRNVEFGPRMQGLGGPERRRRAAEALESVQMTGYAPRKPNQLSGGQQQRVAVARALAARADCLLLDEPLSNLDAKLRMQMRAELRRLVKANDATGVYVTHDQKEALSMADRIAVMHDGKLVQIGTPQEVYNHPATTFVADFLGEANFLDATVVSAGSTATIDTPGGKLLAALATQDASTFPAGAEVTCCVRPERVRLEPGTDSSKPDTPGTLAGRVASHMYLGEIRQYNVALADGTLWRVSALGERAQALAEGDAVRLRIDPKDVALLAE